MSDQLKKYPYLTESLPGVGGRIKETSDDFQVDELPLYEPCGEGTHVYFRIRKVGIPTPVAVDRIARYMGVQGRQIGLAGMKDAHAVTTQLLSLEHADIEKIAAYKDPQLKVIWTGRHGNKLRPGHLAGNRFLIRIRDVGLEQLPAAQEVFEEDANGERERLDVDGIEGAEAVVAHGASRSAEAGEGAKRIGAGCHRCLQFIRPVVREKGSLVLYTGSARQFPGIARRPEKEPHSDGNPSLRADRD